MSNEAFLKFLEPTNAEGSLGRIGVYEVQEIIGRGGMGIVLHASDPDLKRDVAIKVLSPALCTDESSRARFMREARAAAAIDHPSVVPIHGIGLLREIPYLVMPLLAGGTLQERLGDDPMTFEKIIDITEQIAGGLSAAHAEGVVHRDIKPANILFEGSHEKIRIADFGLARALEDATVTKSGMLIGTPEHMAPEQVKGSDVGQHADLYSMGSVLYHMVAGKPPFAADSTMKLIRKVADTRPDPIRQRRSDTPKELADLIEDLMAKEPTDRPDSADAVVARLQTIEITPPPARSLPRLIGAGLAALVIIASLFLLDNTTEPDASKFHIAGEAQGFDSLAGAYAAAAPGAVIEIASSGPIDAGSIEITRPVTIRAAAGFAPELYSGIGDTPVFRVKAAANLEGLGFRGPPTRDPSSPSIVAEGAPLVVANCSFRRRGVTRVRRGRSAALKLTDCPTTQVRNSEFYGIKGAFVEVMSDRPTTDLIAIRIENSIFTGRQGIVIRQSESFPIKLTLVRNTFATQQAIGCPVEGLEPKWEIAMDGNVFSMQRIRQGAPPAVIATPGIPFANLKQGIRWNVGANLYSKGHAYLTSAPTEGNGTGRITRPGSWHGFIGSRARPPLDPPDSAIADAMINVIRSGNYPDPAAFKSEAPRMGIEPELVGFGAAYVRAKGTAK